VLERRAANEQQERIRALTLRKEQEQPLAPGDRVRIVSRAGTFKPHETGTADEVVAGPGQTGVVLRWEKRQSDEFTRIDPNEPLQIVRVRWAAQRWNAWGIGNRPVELPEFEATIHVSYLEPVR
jgi:hypothetical protein